VDLQIGSKIRGLRLRSDLTQDELARRAGLTKGFISQLENDQTSIGVDSLADILDALGVSLAKFFSDSADTQVVFGPEERIEIEETGASKFELLVPGSTNNIMDPVLVELRPGESLDKGEPHPGEQFGFVLSGTTTLEINKTLYKVRPKHCFYFKSDSLHQISNRSDKTTSLLWVVTPPQM